MALVTYGPIVSDARKKIGGVVATKGHAGNFMRKKVSPIQPRTQSQRNVRSSFTAISKLWAGGLSGNVAGWNAFAKATPKKDRFGNSVTLTGLQLFQSLSRNLNTIGVAPDHHPARVTVSRLPRSTDLRRNSGNSGLYGYRGLHNPGNRVLGRLRRARRSAREKRMWGKRTVTS